MSDLPPPTPPEPPPPEPVAFTPPPEAAPPPPPEPAAPAAEGLMSKIPPTEWAGDPLPKDGNEKMLGLVMHLLQLSGLIFVKIPFIGIIGPLVLWLIKKKDSPYLDAMGKEVLNFQINVSVIVFACVMTCILAPLGIVIALASVIFIILAALKVNEGKFYRYPWIYRILK